MSNKLLLLIPGLLIALTSACNVPGPLNVALEPRDMRVDAAGAPFWSKESEKRGLVKKLVIWTDTLLRRSGNARGGELLDPTFNVWLKEFERALIRDGFELLDREKMAAIIEEQRIDVESAAKVIGADAFFQVNLLEFKDATETIDLRNYLLMNGANTYNDHDVQDLACHIDGKLVTAAGSVAWSGEIFFYGSSLYKNRSLSFSLDDTRPGEEKLIVGGPWFNYTWKPEVQDRSMVDAMPATLDAQDADHKQLLAKFAAEAFVRVIFGGA